MAEIDFAEQRRRFAEQLKKAPEIAANMKPWEHSILGTTPLSEEQLAKLRKEQEEQSPDRWDQI